MISAIHNQVIFDDFYDTGTSVLCQWYKCCVNMHFRLYKEAIVHEYLTLASYLCTEASLNNSSQPLEMLATKKTRSGRAI